MKTKLTQFTPILIALGVAAGVAQVLAQGTAFTYQGRLQTSGIPANGSNDFTFAVFQVASSGSPIAGPIKVDDVIISNGLFTATVDFGSGVFTGAVQWLEISVRPGDSGGAYTDLSPRQPITPTPYAIHAASAAVAASANTAIWSGLNGVPPGFADGIDNDTTYGAGLGLSLSGTNFSLNPLYTDGRYWTLFGNSGTSAGANFLGTTDNQPLEIRVNNQRALRLEPNPNGAPNVIAGSPRNAVGVGSVGATIAGGGATNYFGLSYTNSVRGDFGVVGGEGQTAIATDSAYATIAGGYLNDVGRNSPYSAIGGGYDNNIAAYSWYATIGGGTSNDIGTDSHYSTIGGGVGNGIAADSEFSTIAGGYWNDVGTNSNYSAIGGGYDNNIESGSTNSTIAGGSGNDIGTNSNFSAIGGGNDNTIQAGGQSATIAGGDQNMVQTNSSFATIAGGQFNSIAPFSVGATISGGLANGISGARATIGGGIFNHVHSNAFFAVIGGGTINSADGVGVTVGGGENNVATGIYSVIPGGFGAVARSYGQLAHANGRINYFGDAQASEYLLRNYSINNSTTELFLDGVGSRMVLPTNSVWTFLIHVSAIGTTGNDFAAYEVRGVVSTVGSIFLKMTDGSGATVGTAPPIHETASAVTWQATPYVDVPNNEFRIAVGGGPGQVVKWLARVQTTEVMR